MANTINDVIQAFHRLEKNWLEHGDRFAYEFKTSIVRQIVRQRHIDTSAMIRSMNYHREAMTDSSVKFRIDTSDNAVRDVFYDGFLEFPTRRGWPGAFVYQRGIENADVQREARDVMDRSFMV